MSVTRVITLRLEPADYECLAGEARRLGMSLGTLARVYVRAGLARNDDTSDEGRRQAGLRALDRLAELTANLPPIDAVRVARESRAELTRRPIL